MGSLLPCFLLDSTFSPVTQSALASAKPLLQLNSLMPFIPSSHPPKHCPNQSLLIGHWFSHQHANTLLFLLFLKYSPAPPPHLAVSPHFTDRALVRLPPHPHSAVLQNPIVRFLVLTPLQRQQTQPFLGAPLHMVPRSNNSLPCKCPVLIHTAFCLHSLSPHPGGLCSSPGFKGLL